MTEGSVVVITGAGAGIGAALAWACADAGARVALLDRAPQGLADTAERLPPGTASLQLCCDVRDPQACQDAMDEVVRTWGGVDVLVNNAGTSHRSLFADTDLDVVRRVMEVNFFGAVHCTRAALPSLVQRRGTVVAISSVAGFAPLVGRTAYSASKHALHGFFDSLRSEVASQGVAVLVVCPSFVATGLQQSALDGRGRPLGDQARVQAGGALSTREVARRVVRALGRRRRLLLLSPVARLAWWLSRMMPRVYERLMLRAQGGEFA